MTDDEMRRDLIARLVLACRAALAAEACATHDFSLSAYSEASFYSLQELGRLGIIDELLAQTTGEAGRTEYQMLIKKLMREQVLTHDEKESFSKLLRLLSKQSSAAMEQAGSDSAKRGHCMGLICAKNSLMTTLEPRLRETSERVYRAAGAAAAEAATAIALLRGQAEAEFFVKDIDLYISSIVPLYAENVESQLFLSREPPFVFYCLDAEVGSLIGGEATGTLAISAWNQVFEECETSLLQKEAFKLAFLLLRERVSSKVIEECIEQLREETEGLQAIFLESDLLDESRARLDEHLSRSLIAMLETCRNPEIHQWAAVLFGAQEALAGSVDHVGYERCLEEILDAATQVGVLQSRPTIADLDSLFASSPDFDGPELDR